MDETTVKRAQGGDREAMEALLASVAPSIRRFALRMCKNDADADDVLQDALMSIATHLNTFEGRSSVPSWAFALTRSACSRRRRGKKNQPMEDASALESRPAELPGPEEQASSGQMGVMVAKALETLSDDHREVLLLRDVEGLSAPEAATVLGISVDALKSRLHRARSALRETLRPFMDPVALPRPSATACPDVIGALSRKIEGDLDANACAEMEAHINSCPSCAHTCDVLKDALTACRTSAVAGAKLTPAIEAQVRTVVKDWLATRLEVKAHAEAEGARDERLGRSRVRE